MTPYQTTPGLSERDREAINVTQSEVAIEYLDNHAAWEFTGRSLAKLLAYVRQQEAARKEAPADWVLVPREPTEGMLNAAPASHSPSFRVIWPKICGDVYRAMIAAAPTPPPGEQE